MKREMPGSFDDVIRFVMIEVKKALAEGTSIESGVRTALYPVLVGPAPDKPSAALPPVDPIQAALSQGWLRHDGGECPVGPRDRVHFRTQFNLDNPQMPISEDADGREADSLRWVNRENTTWNDNIVLYKVVGKS